MAFFPRKENISDFPHTHPILLAACQDFPAGRGQGCRSSGEREGGPAAQGHRGQQFRGRTQHWCRGGGGDSFIQVWEGGNWCVMGGSQETMQTARLLRATLGPADPGISVYKAPSQLVWVSQQLHEVAGEDLCVMMCVHHYTHHYDSHITDELLTEWAGNLKSAWPTLDPTFASECRWVSWEPSCSLICLVGTMEVLPLRGCVRVKWDTASEEPTPGPAPSRCSVVSIMAKRFPDSCRLGRWPRGSASSALYGACHLCAPRASSFQSCGSKLSWLRDLCWDLRSP